MGNIGITCLRMVICQWMNGIVSIQNGIISTTVEKWRLDGHTIKITGITYLHMVICQ